MASRICFLGLIVLGLLFLTFNSCGKHESEGGTTGAVVGGAAGAVLSNKKNRAEGTLLGALVGNTIGRLAGSQEDRREERERRDTQVRSLKQENYELRKELEKWCPSCRRRSTLKGARACTRCGEPLITEQYCPSCKSYFEPREGHIYCPNCPRVLLSSR